MTGGQGCGENKPFEHCPGHTNVEYRTEFSIWALSGSVLIFATDPRNMTAIMNETLLNTELIAVNQDPAAGPGLAFIKGEDPCSAEV